MVGLFLFVKIVFLLGHVVCSASDHGYDLVNAVDVVLSVVVPLWAVF